ncbi:MAG: tetratricopeptide repeat protein [Phycisphaerales bacterium]|nr:tetratricopeptide repeat protein [Phycisphaerales bacterium]
MASRINTKLVLVLFIVASSAAAAVGALWFYKMKTDASRHIEAAEGYLAQGDYRSARRFYSRAVGKEPTNVAYLASLEDALLKIQPDTADEAKELYQSYLSVLKHAATHHPSDANRHLALMNELYTAARRSRSWWYADLMVEAADDMWSHLPATNPQRIEALFYRGFAQTSPDLFDRQTPEDRQAGRDDLRAYLAEVPDRDAAWAALIRSRLIELSREQDAGQIQRADALLDEVKTMLAEAKQKVPDGPEVLLSSLWIDRYEAVNDKRPLDRDAVRADALRLVSLVESRDETWLIAEAAQMLDSFASVGDLPNAGSLADDFLARHPEAHDLRFVRATLHYYAGDLDKANAATREVQEAELLHVGFLSQAQFAIRERAAALDVDIAMRRWENAPAEEKRAALDGIQQARDALAALLNDSEAPSVVLADGKLAFARRDYAGAVRHFSDVLAQVSVTDFETLMYIALALEQRGEIGAAITRVDEALEQQPLNTAVMLHKARLLGQSGRYETAAETLDKVLELDAGNETAIAMREKIAENIERGDAGATDPVVVAIRVAQAAALDGEFEAARAALLAVRESEPDDLRVMDALIRVEIAGGRTEEALTLVEEVLERVPRNRRFLSLRSMLETQDPIDAINDFVDQAYDNDVDRAIAKVMSLRELALRQEEVAARAEEAGDATLAGQARERVARVRAAEAETRQVAESLAPEHPRFADYKFMSAVTAEDWSAAEEVVAMAGRLNLDQAGGALFQGRYQAARGNLPEAIAALQIATERIPYSAATWRFLGLAYQRVGNITGAVNAFARSYDNNPNDIATARVYGELLARTGNLTRAIAVLRTARRLAPGDGTLREQWLALETQADNLATVLRERYEMHQMAPDRDSDEYKRNAAALARFLGKEEPSRELLLDRGSEERYSIERWNRLPETGPGSRQAIIAQTRTEWRQAADSIVQRLMEPEERDLDWHMLYADLQRARGDVAEGEQTLRDYRARVGDDPIELLRTQLAIGVYLAQLGRSDEAIAAFEAGRQYQTATNHSADAALAELYFNLERFEEATPYFEAVYQADPRRRIGLQLVECYAKIGRFEEARAWLDKETATVDRDAPVALLEATIAKGEGDELLAAGDVDGANAKYDEQRRFLEMAEELDPADPLPHVLLAVTMYEEFKRTGETVLLEDAMVELSRADEVRKDFQRTGLTRVAILQARGDERGAINELTRVVERSPMLDRPRQHLVQLLLKSGRTDAANQLVEEAVQLKPSSPMWHEVLGDITMIPLRQTRRELDQMPQNSRQAGQKRRLISQLRDKANRHYTIAMEMRPTIDLLGKRAESMLSADPPFAEEVVELLESHADEMNESPALRGVYARALAMDEERDKAMEQMRIAYRMHRERINSGIDKRPSISAWYVGLRSLYTVAEAAEAEAFAREVAGDAITAHDLRVLGSFWRARGDQEGILRSVELLQEAIEIADEQDRDLRVRVYADLGVTLLVLKQHELSREALEKVLELEPDHGEALNNLAYLLADGLDDPSAALPYAERAAALRPNSWSVLDTVGWIQYRLGNLDEALSTLRKSVDITPNALNLVHIAHVYADLGELDRAQQYVERAANSRPDADTREQIDRLADDIRSKRRGS